MGKEVDNKFTWVIKNFCSLQSRKVYSDEFVVNGCKWRLMAFPRGNNVEYLSLYLDVAGTESLPYGWKRHATVQISIVNQVSQELSLTRATQHWFDSRVSDWGFKSMLHLNKLHAKDSGFLVNNEVKIVAEVNVLEVIGKLDIADESEEATESLSKAEEDDGAESCDFLKEASSVKESMDVNGFQVLAEVDVLEVTGKLDVADESKEATKSLSKVEEDYGAESYDSLKEASSVKESMDVNGFQVLPSQVESVSRIFERHPDFASEFCPKNQHLRTAYMNVLLGLIEMLCQSTQELSKDDLTDAAAALEYLTNAGFDFDWLEDKLEEVSEKKKKEEAGETRMQEIEEELKDLKLKCSNLKAELKKEKADVSVARSPLSFDDVV